MSFNGEKVKHIFVIEKDTDLYLNEYESHEARKALFNSTNVIVVKIDEEKWFSTGGEDNIKDITSTIHKSHVWNNNIPRKFNDFIDIFNECSIEGLIYEYNDTYWKVKADCFNKNCHYELLKKNKSYEFEVDNKINFYN